MVIPPIVIIVSPCVIAGLGPVTSPSIPVCALSSLTSLVPVIVVVLEASTSPIVVIIVMVFVVEFVPGVVGVIPAKFALVRGLGEWKTGFEKLITLDYDIDLNRAVGYKSIRWVPAFD